MKRIKELARKIWQDEIGGNGAKLKDIIELNTLLDKVEVVLD